MKMRKINPRLKKTLSRTIALFKGHKETPKPAPQPLDPDKPQVTPRAPEETKDRPIKRPTFRMRRFAAAAQQQAQAEQTQQEPAQETPQAPPQQQEPQQQTPAAQPAMPQVLPEPEQAPQPTAQVLPTPQAPQAPQEVPAPAQPQIHEPTTDHTPDFAPATEVEDIPVSRPGGLRMKAYTPPAPPPAQQAPAQPKLKGESLAVGTVLGGSYKITKILGQGGMGVVYEAYQMALKRYVALKVLPSTLIDNPDYLQQFNTEATAAARLEHPNIVPIFGMGSSEQLHYFVMAKVNGQTLEDIIDKRRKSVVKKRRYINEAEALDIILQVAYALEFAHDNEVIHGDIKPANIMIDDAGKIVVTDFGLAVLAKARTHTPKGMMASPLYMSPEQAKGGLVEETSDIYSMGAVLYEMLTGTCAFDVSTVEEAVKAVSTGQIVPPRLRRKEIHPDIESIIMKAMSLNPRDRYPTANSFISDIQRYKGGATISAPVANVIASDTRRKRMSSRGKAAAGGSRFWSSLFFLCAVGATGVAMIFYFGQNKAQLNMQLMEKQFISSSFDTIDELQQLNGFGPANRMLEDLKAQYPDDQGLQARIDDKMELLKELERSTPKLVKEGSTTYSISDRDKDIIERAKKVAQQYKSRRRDDLANMVYVSLVQKYPGTPIAQDAEKYLEKETTAIMGQANQKAQRDIARKRFERAAAIYKSIIKKYKGTSIETLAANELLNVKDQHISTLEIEIKQLRKKLL